MREFLKIDEISEYLGIKKSTLYSKVERKEIPHYKVGNLLRFKKSDIDAWMEKTRVEPHPATDKAQEILHGANRDIYICDAVKKSVADVKSIPYTTSKGRPDRHRGLRKEVKHGNL